MNKTGQDALDVVMYIKKQSYDLSKAIDDYQISRKKDNFLLNIDSQINFLKHECFSLKIDPNEKTDEVSKSFEIELQKIDKELKNSVKEINNIENLYYASYDDLIKIAHLKGITNTKTTDILTPEQIIKADLEYKKLEQEFSRNTGIFNKKDMTFLMVATALQVVRWALSDGIADKIDANNRLSDKDGDAIVERKKHSYEKKHKIGQERDLTSSSSEKYKTWEEIISSSVPYDATKGAAAFGLNLEGRYHRVHTLGHDPLLGWLFGTLNILTSTLTIPNARTFNISKKDIHFESETTIFNACNMAFETLHEDYHRLPAAVFRQSLHMESDAFTKLGLPIPLSAVFSETLAGELYKSQYDSLCLLSDVKTVAKSAIHSIFIDMIIGLIHGLLYDEREDNSRKAYEARTRKILLVSHIISTTSNVIYCIVTKNIKRLDVGGILVMIRRLFLDVRFIRKIKYEFINSKLDAELIKELDKLIAIKNSL